jgi:hypothetical protein
MARQTYVRSRQSVCSRQSVPFGVYNMLVPDTSWTVDSVLVGRSHTATDIGIGIELCACPSCMDGSNPAGRRDAVLCTRFNPDQLRYKVLSGRIPCVICRAQKYRWS